MRSDQRHIDQRRSARIPLGCYPLPGQHSSAVAASSTRTSGEPARLAVERNFSTDEWNLKAAALYLTNRTTEALLAIRDAEELAERSGERYCCTELYRLRGVFLADLGAEEAATEASFRAAMRIAREQKSSSVARRAEASYAEYSARKEERGVYSYCPSFSTL